MIDGISFGEVREDLKAADRAQARADVLALHDAGRLRYDSASEEWGDDVNGPLSTMHLFAANAMADVLDLQQAGLLRSDEEATTWTVVRDDGETLSLSIALQAAAATLARSGALGRSGERNTAALNHLRGADLAVLRKRLAHEHETEAQYASERRARLRRTRTSG